MKENKIKDIKIKDIKVKDIKVKNIKVFFARTLLTIQVTLLKVIKFIKDNRKNPVINYIFPVWDELINKKIYMYKNTIQTLKNKNDMEIMHEIEKENKDFEKIGKLKKKQAKYTIKGKNTLPKICWCEKVFLGFWLFRTPTRIFYLIFVTLRSLTLVKCPTSDLILTNLFRIFFKNTLFLLLHYFIVTMQISKRVENEESWEIFIWMDYEVNFDRLEREYYAAIDGTLRWAREEEYQQGNEETEDKKTTVKNDDNPYADVWEKYFKLKYKNIWDKKPIYPEFKNEDNTEIHIMPYTEITHSDYMKDRELISTLMQMPIYRIHDNWNDVYGKVAIEFSKSTWIAPYTFNEVIDTGKENVIVLGKSVKEDITWDMDNMPHAMIIGGTGSGKSVASKNWIRQFIEKEHLLYIVDLKSGTENTIFTHKGYTVFKEREECLELLNQIYAEQKFRNKLFVETSLKETKELGKIIEIKDRKGYNNWAKKNGNDLLPRIVVFIDEWSNATSDKDEISEQIISVIAKLLKECRSSGINFIFSLQRPDANFWGGGATRGQIELIYANKMNTTDENYSKEVLGIGDAVRLPKGKNTGHAYVKDDTGLLVLVRSPFENEEKFAERVSKWKENPYKNYILHTENDEISPENIFKLEQELDENKINVKVDDEGEENTFNAKKIF